MSEYVNLMWGRLDGDTGPGTVDLMVADLNRAMPLRIKLVIPSFGLICELIGQGFIIHLLYRPGNAELPDGDEPWSSHPFTGEIAKIDPDLDDLAVADKVFDALAETGRYRVLILYKEEALRATHSPIGPWPW